MLRRSDFTQVRGNLPNLLAITAFNPYQASFSLHLKGNAIRRGEFDWVGIAHIEDKVLPIQLRAVANAVDFQDAFKTL